jgi:adenosine deaminase
LFTEAGSKNMHYSRPTKPVWHIHGDGSIPFPALFNLAKRQFAKYGEELLKPDADVKGNKIEYGPKNPKLLSADTDLQQILYNINQYSLTDVFSYATKSMQDEEGIRAAVSAYFEYLVSQNITHAETHYAAQYHTARGLSMNNFFEIAVDEIKTNEEITGVRVGVISAIGREAEPEIGIDVAKATIDAQIRYPRHILALGLACYEPPFPPERHLKAFEMTFGTPLKRHVHAGEMPVANCILPEIKDYPYLLENVRTAVFRMKADAVGHGIPVYQDRKLIEYMIENQIRLESCPNSNTHFFRWRLSDLHLDELVESGLLVGHNPDNPAMIPFGSMNDIECRIVGFYGRETGGYIIDKMRENLILGSWLIHSCEKELLSNRALPREKVKIGAALNVLN